ncbi:type II toxin-antitoxin system PrlF family antitoxin [Bordetella bronchialis]|uniref:Regulator n=1 Tax=Bordetella bronchialis TaxID=463025 RepID=A0A193FHP2_9BORD|nr:type II toxin-antitoxin system PrlF family antitoxin [Bordetella bronchialis]ANN66711.1 regulator [Bordetella bronchialis]ANN71790.1 regulator [Bordetella bronchialis]
MTTTLEVESSLTDRYQTTVPETVRRALGLRKRDKIHYSVRANGEVILSRGEPMDEPDPALEAFLAFLARDIAAHPERLTPLTADLLARVREASAGAADIDLDAALSPDDE